MTHAPIPEAFKPKLGRIRDTATSHAMIEAKTIAHRRRMEVLHCIRERHISVKELRAMWPHDKPLRILRVIDVLTAIRSRKWAQEACRELDLDPERRIPKLGPAQWHRLISKADGAHR